MISGVFHAISQEWRYFSREKSIVHTLHMAQIPPYVTGSTVLISTVPPTGTGQNGFNAGKQLSFPPITPYNGFNITQVNNNLPPIWMSPSSNSNSFQFPQSGSYGGWSGTMFVDITNVPNGGERGEWFQPLATGGTFLYLTSFNLDLQGNPSVFDTVTAQLSRANPLVIGAGTAQPPDPSNYADAFFTFQGKRDIPGNGWGNFDEGNKYVQGFGNAMALEIGTIVQHVPYRTWLGEHEHRQDDSFYWLPSNYWHAIILRLGP